MWHSGLRFIIPVRIRYNKITSLVTGVIVDLSEKILSRLKLRQLRVIVAIEDFSSLKGAAEILGLSQPAVTKTVQELEADFAIKLFDRTNRRVIATNSATRSPAAPKFFYSPANPPAQRTNSP